MAVISTGQCGLLVVILCSILVNHVTEGAAYGENCTVSSDCMDQTLTCSPNNTCTCVKGYIHFIGEQECEIPAPVNDIRTFVPDLMITSQTRFKTDMDPDDVDMERFQEIKTQMELELTSLFMNLTGFKYVQVTSVTIDSSHLLVVRWTVTINREDPKFVNATPWQIADILRPELEDASKRYMTVIRLDTSKREPPKKGGSDKDKKLSLGLGIGLGSLGFVIFICLVVAILCRRKQKRAQMTEKPAMSISDKSSSFESGKSSKMDPDNYQYDVYMQDGFSIPPPYAKFAPPSDTGSSSALYVDLNEKLTFEKAI